MGMQKDIVSFDTLYQKTSLNLCQIVIIRTVSNFSVFFLVYLVLLWIQNDFGPSKKSCLFWTGPICFDQVQIIKTSPEKSNLNLTKMIWTGPKRIVPIPKQFWTYRRTGHTCPSYGQYCIVSEAQLYCHSRKKNCDQKIASFVCSTWCEVIWYLNMLKVRKSRK